MASKLNLVLAGIVALASNSVSAGSIKWQGSQVDDLFREYGNVFKHGNRNAASHLWASFLINRSENFDKKSLPEMFAGFCAVSGSIVRPNNYNRYGLRLEKVPAKVDLNKIANSGATNSTDEVLKACSAKSATTDSSTAVDKKEHVFGFMHYCCWPCVCDTQDFIKVDTKTMKLKNGVEEKFHFAVIANPCDKPEMLTKKFYQPFDGRETSIMESAGEVRCGADGNLIGATLSDNGYPIIAMFFDGRDASGVEGERKYSCENNDKDQPGRVSSDMHLSKRDFQSECEYQSMCRNRAANGYNSGMGEIFRKVAGISEYKPLGVDGEQCSAFLTDGGASTKVGKLNDEL